MLLPKLHLILQHMTWAVKEQDCLSIQKWITHQCVHLVCMYDLSAPVTLTRWRGYPTWPRYSQDICEYNKCLLMQGDHVTAVCCAYIQKVHCAVCPHYILDPISHFRRIFQVKGENSQQSPLEWKDSVSYGIEILIDNYFILSQYMHLTDRHTKLREQYRALHYMPHGKNWSCLVKVRA